MLSLAVIVAGVAVTVAALREPYHFAVVEPAVLHHSGQLDGAELETMRASRGLGTIVDLCIERWDSPKALEELSVLPPMERSRGHHDLRARGAARHDAPRALSAQEGR